MLKGIWTLIVVGLLVTVLPPAPANAQADVIVISEIVADNTSTIDNFDETPDWIELRNDGDATVDLAGWSIGDDDATWTLPSISLAAGGRAILWASDRDLAGPFPHTNFKLSSTGETVRLGRPDGSLADSMTYPELQEDRAWGRSSSGGIGYLATPTPGSPNTALAPSGVTISQPGQVFTDNIETSMAASLEPGQVIRYTTDGSPVTSSSPSYGGALVFDESTVLRAAVEGGGVVGPESTEGYILISSSIVDRSSDIPLVLIHSTGQTSPDFERSAVVAIIDRGDDGRARVLDDAVYTGFAGLRERGRSSITFPKKQFKFELWDNPQGDSRAEDLFGLGSDDDWGLYAPGFHDRAMINNAWMYELGHRVGVPAPDYQFVELYLEDDFANPVGGSDYRGLYLLRETIEIDDDRVDITKPRDDLGGSEIGYIVRHDGTDDCCRDIREINDLDFVTYVAVDSPDKDELTSSQRSYIDGWWDDMLDAAGSGEMDQINQYIDIDQLIDYWLLIMLSGDPDGLRLSTYMHKDSGERLRGGPLWDFDRTLGSSDLRNDEIAEMQGWGQNQLLLRFDFFGDLWDVPEVRARLRARWRDLRLDELRDSQLGAIADTMRDEISEAFDREDDRWRGTDGYGARFGNGIFGEVENFKNFAIERARWMDGSLVTDDRPFLDNPEVLTLTEGQPFTYDFEVTGGSAFAWSHTDLPAGLTLSGQGRLEGTVALGDAETKTVVITVTNDSGGYDDGTLEIRVAPAFAGSTAMVLNEFNAVGPARLLDANGSDAALGRVGGNGGDWFEVVTIEDNLDLRDWRFDLFTNDIDQVRQTASLRLGDDDLLADIRAGTIITVAESIPEDLSYDPANGDWTLNLQANSAQAGALWQNQTDFDTNNTKWRLVVREPDGTIRAPIAGETEPWDDANFGVSDGEIMRLAVDPSDAPDLVNDYADGIASTFGLPNPTADGGAQDFSSLRPTIAVSGNVNCDDRADIVDALVIAQFAVGNRTDAGQCPLPDPVTNINAAEGDLNRDGRADIVDALLVSQCSVGVINEFC